MTLYTIGHSTRSLEELVQVLRSASIEILADVRRFPASRRHPHFNRDALDAALARVGVRYVWLGEELGGRRKATLPAERSPNAAWTVEAFRHYADAMETEDFQAGARALEGLVHDAPTAVMCAERPWWKCHRRLLADLFTVRGHRCVHLLEADRHMEHELAAFARVKGGRLTYPALL